MSGSLIEEILAGSSAISEDQDLPGNDLVDKLTRLQYGDREHLISLRTKAEIEVGDLNTIPPSVDQLQRHFGRLAIAAAFAKIEFGGGLPRRFCFRKGSFSYTAEGNPDGNTYDFTLFASHTNLLQAGHEDIPIYINPDCTYIHQVALFGTHNIDDATVVFNRAGGSQVTLLSVLHQIASSKGYQGLSLKEFIKAAVAKLNLQGAFRKRKFKSGSHIWVLSNGSDLANAIV